jgi:hypothetical protein
MNATSTKPRRRTHEDGCAGPPRARPELTVAADDDAIRVVRGIVRGLALAVVAWAGLAFLALVIIG